MERKKYVTIFQLEEVCKMKKNIYDLFNEMEIDTTKYEEIALSEQEKKKLKQNITKEIRTMNLQKPKNKKNAWFKIAAASLTVLLLVGCTTAAARGIFSDVIEKLILIAQEDKYEVENTEKYKKIGEHAKDVKKEIQDMGLGKEVYKTEAENNGIHVAVSDIYCDGYQLHFIATLTGEKNVFHNSDWIHPFTKETISVLTINGIRAYLSPEIFQKSEDNTYIMMGTVNLLTIKELTELELKNGDPILVEYKIETLHGSSNDKWDENGEYATTFEVNGEWELKFPVQVDNTSNIVIDIKKEENGITLQNVVKTKIGMVLSVELPDMTKEPYNDINNNPEISICAENGTFLQILQSSSKQREDGSTIETVMILDTDEKNLRLKVVNKNATGEVIADIPFQIPTK